MGVTLVQFSVVVSGSSHNPTLLNPDFLQARGIVPKEWGWEVSPNPITTPPFSQVRYSNGVAISLEHTKLQVVDISALDDPTESKAPEIAEKFVTTLPHVRYTGVGHNFVSLLERENAASELKTQFLKEGAWNADKHRMKGIGLRLIYPLADDSGRVVLSLDEGASSEEGKQDIPMLVINANFHRECGDHSDVTQVIERLSHVAEDWTMHQELLASIQCCD